jgi:hypothetical protein
MLLEKLWQSALQLVVLVSGDVLHFLYVVLKFSAKLAAWRSKEK